MLHIKVILQTICFSHFHDFSSINFSSLRKITFKKHVVQKLISSGDD